MGKSLAEFSRFVLHFLVSFVPKLLSDLIRELKRNKMQFEFLVFLVNSLAHWNANRVQLQQIGDAICVEITKIFTKNQFYKIKCVEFH